MAKKQNKKAAARASAKSSGKAKKTVRRPATGKSKSSEKPAATSLGLSLLLSIDTGVPRDPTTGCILFNSQTGTTAVSGLASGTNTQLMQYQINGGSLNNITTQPNRTSRTAPDTWSFNLTTSDIPSCPGQYSLVIYEWDSQGTLHTLFDCVVC
jgi:hypothetical protein